MAGKRDKQQTARCGLFLCLHFGDTKKERVGSELSDELRTAPYAHEGFNCFVAPSSSDLFRIIGRIWSLARSLPNEPLAEFERLLKEEPSTTEVEHLRKERIGQNVFRSALMDYWEKSCAVTGVKNPTLLRASHIVPWATCETDEERLNVHNGLLLVATLDAAFDTGLITFKDNGGILISRKLSLSDQQLSGISSNMRLTRMNEEVRKRLDWHRVHMFES